MRFLGYTFILLLILFISIRTVSFGLWTWKKKNRLGAVMVFAVALISAVLPVYMLFVRK